MSFNLLVCLSARLQKKNLLRRFTSNLEVGRGLGRTDLTLGMILRILNVAF